MRTFNFDEIGYWSEIKLEIIRDYAVAYSTILSAQSRPRLTHIYIDAFAGAGLHISKADGKFIPGSPLNALSVKPPFKEHHLIDLNSGKAQNLRNVAGERLNKDVFVYEGDCNKILLESVFPKARYTDFRRALCILDPYGLQLDWRVIEAAGKSRSTDIFLNFPVMDMNRNILWRNPELVNPAQASRLSAFWGDESWKSAGYRENEQGNLFGDPDLLKTSNDDLTQAFKDRLRDVAGFANVIDPLPMRNNQGATVYFLYFASQNATGNRIATAIFDKFRNRGTKHG